MPALIVAPPLSRTTVGEEAMAVRNHTPPYRDLGYDVYRAADARAPRICSVRTCPSSRVAATTTDDEPRMLCTNRDEFLVRPTQTAHFHSAGRILSGIDVQAGGTWCGLSTTGRVALLYVLGYRRRAAT